MAHKRKGAADSDFSPCIEVTHPATGFRFVLSKRDGVWLLSAKDRPDIDRSDLEFIVASLREQFAARDLGPVDIVW